MSNRVVARRPDGAEYGFDNADIALAHFDDAEIVRYVDGSPYPGDEAKGEGDSSKPVSKMNREELEAHAESLGIEDPGNKETFPNVGSLREAINDAESTKGPEPSGDSEDPKGSESNQDG